MRTNHVEPHRARADTTVTVRPRRECYTWLMERTAVARHPKGSRARVLLTSVFGPYAQDDEYGSRAVNPMELYHNQVTRDAGRLLAADVPPLVGPDADPGQHRGALHAARLPDASSASWRSCGRVQYDVVGISSIMPNLGKVKRDVRARAPSTSPQATIVVGGHVANLPGLRERIDADHVVARRGRRLVPRASWARTRARRPPPADRLGLRRPHDGRTVRARRGRHGGHR